MLVFGERENRSIPEKNLSEQSREPTKLSPLMTPSLGIEPGTHWWKASALTTAPTLINILGLSLLVISSYSLSTSA